jgi:hypothetical protein
MVTDVSIASTQDAELCTVDRAKAQRCNVERNL